MTPISSDDEPDVKSLFYVFDMMSCSVMSTSSTNKFVFIRMAFKLPHFKLCHYSTKIAVLRWFSIELLNHCVGYSASTKYVQFSVGQKCIVGLVIVGPIFAFY